MIANGRALVVDTSVVAKWFLLDEPLMQEAIDLWGLNLSGSVDMYAPSSLLAELFNVFWQRYRRSQLSLLEVEELWRDFRSTRTITLYDVAHFTDSAVQLALEFEVIVYDALFISVAEHLGSQMVTADYKLIANFTGTRLERLIVPLDDIAKFG